MLVEPCPGPATEPEGVPVALEGQRGSCRCPCGGHRNGDASPSAVFDLRLRRLTCQVHGTVMVLRRLGQSWWAYAKTTGNRCRDVGSSSLPDQGGIRWAGAAGARPSRPGVLTRPLAVDSTGAVLGAGSPMRWRGSWGWLMRARDRWERTHAGWEEHAALDCDDRTTRVLFDLDGLAFGSTSTSTARTIHEAVSASELFDGAESVVDTSLHGVQVVASLTWCRRPVPFYADGEVRAELRRIGAAVLEVLGRGGWVDEAVWARGRHARLPGPRIRDGAPSHARLVALPLADWWAR